MTNAEVFENYGSERFSIEQNLCMMLLQYWEELQAEYKGHPIGTPMPINPVGFVKNFMKQETHLEIERAEQEKLNFLEKNVIDAQVEIIENRKDVVKQKG